MDYKKLETKDSGDSYYNMKWLVKNVTITLISSMPSFYWASNQSDSNSFLYALVMIPVLFVLIFIADLFRRIAMPQAVISEGGAIEMIKKKIYWAIGPQFVIVIFAYVVIFIILNISLTSKNNTFINEVIYKKSQEKTASMPATFENKAD